MTLQVLNSFPYTFLPSGILIVEPHEGLLTARSMLLAAADHYVGVSACSWNQSERNEEREVSIAILSESLGRAVLNGTAEIVRRNWPRARILIFGSSGAAIEDHLYDARIDRPPGRIARSVAYAYGIPSKSESDANCHLGRWQSGTSVDWWRNWESS
jgi:hypothetical protein